MKNLSTMIKSLPMTSGVYLMKNADGKIIYVGKAVSLRKRVQSYFRTTKHPQVKTEVLVSLIHHIDYMETKSEAEALILEASLIKKYRPVFNIDLKDDKSYPFIEITPETFPKVSIQRPKVKKEGSTYYGPYVNPKLIREALILLRKIFPFRTCNHFPKTACLDQHIGLCSAPCIAKISVQEYQKNIRSIRYVLEGKKEILLRTLRRDMERLSEKNFFEEAAKVRDQLQAIGALYSGTKDVNTFKEAEQLQRMLKLSRMPQRIETFDISNIMGQHSVGAMVSFLNGKPDKKNYRKFKIKEVEGIDDFAMISEIVKRRYQRLKKEGKTFPDLIVIDGGKGQLSSAVNALMQVGVDIPIVSIAKKEEEIFLPKRKTSIKMPKDSLGLKLLQRMRDEAHRFAVTYHKLLRKKEMIGDRRK